MELAILDPAGDPPGPELELAARTIRDLPWPAAQALRFMQFKELVTLLPIRNRTSILRPDLERS